jgi:hypothetical protein
MNRPMHKFREPKPILIIVYEGTIIFIREPTMHRPVMFTMDQNHVVYKNAYY